MGLVTYRISHPVIVYNSRQSDQSSLMGRSTRRRASAGEPRDSRLPKRAFDELPHASHSIALPLTHTGRVLESGESDAEHAPADNELPDDAPELNGGDAAAAGETRRVRPVSKGGDRKRSRTAPTKSTTSSRHGGSKRDGGVEGLSESRSRRANAGKGGRKPTYVESSDGGGESSEGYGERKMERRKEKDDFVEEEEEAEDSDDDDDDESEDDDNGERQKPNTRVHTHIP